MTYKTVQLIDPNFSTANQMKDVLTLAGYRVKHFTSATGTLEHDFSGITLISSSVSDMSMTEWIRRNHHARTGRNAVAIAIVNQDEGMLAADAMKSGATDYLLKPFESNQLISLLQRVETLEKPQDNIVAESWRSKQVLQLAHRAACTNATVLITGESGTGKEVLARYVHLHSSRRSAPFVAVNCAAIPETMLEAVLFGHVKGAFTGATQNQTGKFEEANGGSVLLDEIAEMSPALQAKLLRVLQEREVERIGSHKPIKLDIRVIAATNQNLRDAVQKGQFREDLYYRLDVLPLHWPPLRERSEDILPLCNFFIQKFQDNGHCCLANDAKSALLHYQWPGNIRELQNIIQRAMVMRHGDFITAHDLMLPEDYSAMPCESSETLKGGHIEAKKKAEYQHIIHILRQFGGNRTQTANALGVTTRALRYKLAAMREQGIDLQAVLGSAA